MKNDYVPATDSDIFAFEESFIAKFPEHATALGLDPSEVSEAINIITTHRNTYTAMNSKKGESKSAIEQNRNQKYQTLREIRRISKLLKSSKKYTEAIGKDLGIIGPEIQVKSSAELKPVLKAEVNGMGVVIQFRKEDTSGIKLYSKRGTESDFSFLAVDTESPYNDNRSKLEPSKPEQREYYAYFFESDSDIGQRSDIIKVVVP